MKAKWQNRLNILLGVISLWLAGCSSSKSGENVLMYGIPPEIVKYGPPFDTVIALYGVQMPDEELLKADSTEVEEPKQDPVESAQ